ncbi:MAG: acetylornithine/succinylornithine family transaminase, partial [Candidatus Hydrothermarchaeota archaeon]|nr:acetylornithine/succinylornithine family transaminase [Candidatus Hydrothermarchaeota archaeon]
KFVEKWVAKEVGKSRLTEEQGKGLIGRIQWVGDCAAAAEMGFVVEAVTEQAAEIMHSSNVYHIIPQVELAELLYRVTGGYKSFFCNSGAEANEAAIKLVRKYKGKSKIIAAKNSFHGRTIATLSATGQEKYKRNFEPLCKEFTHVKFGDMEDLEQALTKETAAVMLEPIQGEGGVVVPSQDYLLDVRKLCDENNVLLILDEVQTGFGRMGELFAWQLYKIKPDIFTVAKALGGGFPIGAMLAREDVMDVFKVGDHASTFGGNHLACTVAKAALEVIIEEKLPQRAEKLGEYLMSRLMELQGNHEVIRDVRGRGLMVGIELKKNGSYVVEAARERGVLLNCTHENVVRLLPPLVVKKEQLDRVVKVLDEVL